MMRTLLYLALCAAALRAEIHVDWDEGVPFNRFKTFRIQGGEIRSKHPQLNNEIVEQNIRSAVKARLEAKGLTESETPDLLVTYRVGTRERREAEMFPQRWRGFGRKRQIYNVTDSTVVVDLRESTKRELVWRATCTETLRNASKAEEQIRKDIEKAFKDYPPRRK